MSLAEVMADRYVLASYDATSPTNGDRITGYVCDHSCSCRSSCPSTPPPACSGVGCEARRPSTMSWRQRASARRTPARVAREVSAGTAAARLPGVAVRAETWVLRAVVGSRRAPRRREVVCADLPAGDVRRDVRPAHAVQRDRRCDLGRCQDPRALRLARNAPGQPGLVKVTTGVCRRASTETSAVTP